MHMLVLFIIFPRGPIFCPTLYPRPLRGSEALVKEASEPRKGPGYEVVFWKQKIVNFKVFHAYEFFSFLYTFQPPKQVWERRWTARRKR
jgi:hypothetical protein